MKFNEENFTELKDEPLVFIYFLLQDDEVVYVGKTTRGYSRIIDHYHSAKIFNKVYYITCAEEDLDELENYYICKYNPKYNKTLNLKCYTSFSSAVTTLNQQYLSNFNNYMTRRRLAKIVEYLNIKPLIFNNQVYLHKGDFALIEGIIESGLKGAPVNEIFNLKL